MSSMMNEPLNAIFLHIPKSAGTSVTIALSEGKYGNLWVQGENVANIQTAIADNDIMIGRKVSHPNHARAMDLRAALGPDTFDRQYSFSFVRNPFDRIASTYHYIRDNPKNRKSAMTAELGFEQYIVYNCLVTPQLQSDWLYDLNGNRIVNDIFRVENIQQAGVAVGQKLFGAVMQFNQANKSQNATRQKSTLWNVVPDWVVDLFVRTYAEDFAKTGYSTDVGPFKTENCLSDEARNGAWEALPQYLMPATQKAAKLNRKLQRDAFLPKNSVKV